MAVNVLVAALGDHPSVITGAVRALREQEGIHIQRLYVLYSQDTEASRRLNGFDLVRKSLEMACDVQGVPLPFADANTSQRSVEFLHEAVQVLKPIDDPALYNVYLLLAAGRKNMAALLALVAQFFASVRGLYHLIDLAENTVRAAFVSAELLDQMLSDKEVRSALDPPLTNVRLFPVPYPGAHADAKQLWDALSQPGTTGLDNLSLPLSPAAEAFFRQVAVPAFKGAVLDVCLSRTALAQYEALGAADADAARGWLALMEQMRDPVALMSRSKPAAGRFYWYQRPGTPEQALFYTEPGSFLAYPEKTVNRTVICSLSHQADAPPGEEPMIDPATVDAEGAVQLQALAQRERVLLVSLGLSPMVATQTYMLLTAGEAQGKPRVPVVALLYGAENPVILDCVRLLKRQFKARNVEVRCFPIDGIGDIDSTDACHTYLEVVHETIEKLQTDFAGLQIDMSLSGGRKGMSALSYFAAQKVGVKQVYHTLITDPELEKRVEEEGSLEGLDKLRTDADRGRRLFLEQADYDRSLFELFTIPVVPLISKPSI